MRINPTPDLTMSSKKSESGDTANAAGGSGSGSGNNGRDPNASDELTVVVEDLLNSLSNKFAGVSSEIFAKMDEMSRRLDNLEAALQAQNNDSTKP